MTLHFVLDAQFNSYMVATKVYIDAYIVDFSYKSYEDNSVKIRPLALRAGLLALSMAAPGIITETFGKGVDIEPILKKIPIVCALDLSNMTLVPRNAYALLSYTPMFDPYKVNECDTEHEHLYDYILTTLIDAIHDLMGRRTSERLM